MEMNKPKIPPIYNRASNLQRKMELMLRHIADIKNMLYYYDSVFEDDPWFAQRLQEAEKIYADLEAAFKEALKGLGSEEQIQEACRYVAQKHPAARKELAKGPETEG